MEFHIDLCGAVPGLDVLDDALRCADPSALVDIDPGGNVLRISTSIGAAQLATLVRQAGLPVSVDQVRQLPSICCGGCSG